MSKWMPSCREISRVVSESFDRNLPLRRRMALWMHLLMCGHCSRFRKELLAIRRAVRNGRGPEITEDEAAMPNTARERIKRTLQRAAEESR